MSFAKELANLQRINLTCKVCGIDNNVTIHDTQENVEGNEETGDEISDPQNDLVIANANKIPGLG